ncbi:MAG: inorganic phosphate transporter, partial [Bacteroidales bacterium]|nr:inorganic phosphate transporter [Bacteroidales bacterium]
EERFGSTGASRAIVRTAIGINHIYNSIIPEGIKRRINNAFTPLSEEERKDVAYDNIRAVVNLTAAAILICVGTSLKLPLSTTYVVFMVAMGSSLADRAWGRDSAVYRISGVMVVISGWFVTALAGFTIAVVIVTLLMWGGWIALLIIAILCGYALCYNLIFKSKRKEIVDKPMFNAGAKETDVLFSCTEYVCKTMEEISSIYNHMLVAIFTENRRVLKETVEQSEAIYLVAHKKKIGVLSTLKKLQEQNIETAHFYVQVVDYLDEVSKALLHCTRPAYEHIENNHKSLNEEQIIDLKVVNDSVDEIFNKINEMLRNHDFSNINEVMTMRESLFGIIAESIKNQIKRLKTEDMSTKASALYLNILNETKNMVLQSRNLLKAQAYFLDEIDSEKDKGEEITARS